MFVIGLTGGIGSGKSTIAKLFSAHSVTILDTDLIAREVVLPGSPALHQIAQHFSGSILNPRGELDRKELSEIVFANPDEKKWLEDLLHPLIWQCVVQRLKQSQSPYSVVVVPLLIETGLYEEVDRILVIDCPLALQKERTIARDSMDAEKVDRVIMSQIDREKRLSFADDVIENTSDMDSLTKRVGELHKEYCRLARQTTRAPV